MAQYRAVIRLQPDHASAHNNLGHLLEDHSKDYAGAEAGDSFALLSSMEVMRPTGGLEVPLA